jgi:hypothetical protein
VKAFGLLWREGRDASLARGARLCCERGGHDFILRSCEFAQPCQSGAIPFSANSLMA